MPELLIKKTTTTADFEELLATPNLGEHTLVVPNSISHAGALGCSMAFTQFILTWSRASMKRQVRTFLEPDDDDAHTRFVQRVHGLAAAYYGDSLGANGDPSQNLRSLLLRAARQRILAMQRADLGSTSRGTEIEMIFVSGARHDFHGSLYSKAPNAAEVAEPEAHGRLVRNKSDLNAFLEDCFRFLNAHKPLSHHLLRTDLPFGTLLSEAFKNTAEHACAEPGGSKLNRNMRCVRIARTQVEREWIESFNVGAPEAREAAQQYFESLASKFGTHSRKNVDIAELSIFDSGRGFSRTMGASLATNEEGTDVDLVRKCFVKHYSSKPQTTSGVGIQRMLSAVADLGGFMRIRTSSAEAFFACSNRGGDANDPETFVHGGMAPVEGTLITVGIPVAY